MVNMEILYEINTVTIFIFALSSFVASLVISKCVALYADWCDHGRTKQWDSMPPGPRPWPIVGNLPAILPGGQPHRSLARLAGRYGPIMTVSLGPMSSGVIVLSSAEVVKDVLVRNGHATSDRRIPPLLGYAFSTKGSVIWENGATWKAHRRLILTAFRKCINTSSSFNATLTNSLMHLRDSLVKSGATPRNPRAEITAAVSEVMCSLCFGHCLDVRSDPKIAEVMRAMHEFSTGLSGISLAHIFPRLYFTPLYAKLRGNIFQLRNFLENLVQDHKTNRTVRENPSSCFETVRENRAQSPEMVQDQENPSKYPGNVLSDAKKNNAIGKDIHKEDSSCGRDPTHLADVTDYYLKEVEREKRGENTFVETGDIWRVIFDLLGAGTETTSETLLWGILFLCLNPEVQTKVQSEIDNEVALDSNDGVITYDKRGSLPYTQATVYELLRCACVAPLSLPRVTSSDVTVRGYRIPRGTEVWVNEWAINHDESIWKNPTEFDPARFLDETGNIDRSKKDAIIAFGEGRRMCLGRNLAEIKLFTFFSNLLRWFTFKFPENCRSRPDVNEGNFGLVYSTPAFDVIVSPR